jgi:hypothetical protein
MTSITVEYLVDIIVRQVGKTIALRRNNPAEKLMPEYCEATDEEIVDFIFSIPYFDIKLKDFLLGNVDLHNIIISQTWENEFIKKCSHWAEDMHWLDAGKDYFESPLKIAHGDFSLPY